MTTVDPYTHPFPKTIQDKSGNITPEFRQWLVFDNRWKFDMWIRSGGGDDAVSAGSDSHGYSENLISLLIGQVAFLKERVDALEKESPILNFTGDLFNTVTTSNNYIAADYDFINAKANALITLPKYPSENSVIIIRNGDGSTIKLNPNGKTINGESIGYIRRNGTALVIHYFIDSDEWLVR